MRDGEGGVSNAEVRGSFGGASAKADAGSPARFPHHFDFKPAHTPADSGSQCFGRSLFGGEAGCEAFSSVSLAHAVGLFGRGVNPIEEALAKTLQRLLNARDFNEVDAAADNHAVYQPTIRTEQFGADGAA